uniref:Dehydrogenase/reductase (SDR family) member 13a, duplicate 3 n=1 Tax=Mola mola TaxID=94237 RepID=A0A3Q3WQU3_MOLML
MLMGPLLLGLLSAGAYFLFHATFLKLPRCKSTAKLHGKTAIKMVTIDLTIDPEVRACSLPFSSPCDQVTGNSQVVFMQLDLASLKSVRSFAEDFLRSESRLDLLINNAGLVNGGKTEDGFGMIFGVNHLGHFLLTVLLLDRLKASAPSRVVTVASEAHELGKVDFDCLTNYRQLVLGGSEYQLFRKYCHSKLCNVLFTYELAERLRGSGVTCYSLHPGQETDISRRAGFWWRLILTPVTFLFFADAESGAQTTLHCALEPGIEHLSGHYFSQCAPLARPRDAAAARKLWELSERLSAEP